MKMSMGKVAGVLAIIGAILLIASAFLGWYVVSISENALGVSVTATETFLPGSSYTSNALGSTTTQSYSSSHLNNTGGLFMITQYILIGGFVLALLGGILYFASTMRGRESWSKPAMILLVLALLLAIVAPAYVAGALPGAFKSDSPTGQSTNTSGPWSSFIGSCSTGSGCFGGQGGGGGSSGTATWGPGVGWYLAVVAFVLLLVSVILLWRAKMAPAESDHADAPMAAPAASDTYSMDTSVPPQAPPGGSQ